MSCPVCRFRQGYSVTGTCAEQNSSLVPVLQAAPTSAGHQYPLSDVLSKISSATGTSWIPQESCSGSETHGDVSPYLSWSDHISSMSDTLQCPFSHPVCCCEGPVVRGLHFLGLHWGLLWRGPFARLCPRCYNMAAGREGRATVLVRGRVSVFLDLLFQNASK